MKMSNSQKDIIKERIHYRTYDLWGERHDKYGIENSAGSWYMEISYSLMNMHRYISNGWNGKNDNYVVDYFMAGYATRKLREICMKSEYVAKLYEPFFGRNLYNNKTLGENSAEVNQ